MTSEETITLTRREYDALIERNSQLEDMLAGQDADDGVRVPHEVALDIMRGKGPILAFRNHQGITLRACEKILFVLMALRAVMLDNGRNELHEVNP